MDVNVTSEYSFNGIFFHEKTEMSTLLIGIAVEDPVTHKSQFGHLLACAAAVLPPTSL
jgi:aminopeptidase N